MEFINNQQSKYKIILDQTKEENRLGMHSFHRYYGKLIPAIPRAFIREFTSEGDLVFDPFSGSGTVALEAKQANRNFVGVEINPLSVLISKIKVEEYDINILNKIYEKIIFEAENDNEDILDDELPFCVNRDHWFKDFVQIDLVKIQRNIQPVINHYIKDSEEINKYFNFFNGVLSAIVKQVSNADTMHVFPGISKRVRALEKEGKIHINVFESYKRACKKRINYVGEVAQNHATTKFILANSANVDLSNYYNCVDLVVTNPPYISSVRYAETLKLELYWMGIVKGTTEYANLSNSMIGNDHIKKENFKDKKLTKYDFINNYIEKLFEIDPKQAKVLYDFFDNMEKVIINMFNVLKRKGKLVMKISDSKIRKVKVPTGKLLTQIAEKNGFRLIDAFNDKINENSRSLLTARNTYSDIILEDNIIIWEKL